MSVRLERCYVECAANMWRIRHDRGLLQKDVAKKIGVTPACYSHLECARQRVQMHDLPAIAAALGVTVKDLLPRAWR